MLKTTFYLEDLSCPDCANKIETILNKQEGVKEAKVHYTTSKAKINYDENIIDIEQLKEVVGKTGYGVEKVK